MVELREPSALYTSTCTLPHQNLHFTAKWQGSSVLPSGQEAAKGRWMKNVEGRLDNSQARDFRASNTSHHCRSVPSTSVSCGMCLWRSLGRRVLSQHTVAREPVGFQLSESAVGTTCLALLAALPGSSTAGRSPPHFSSPCLSSSWSSNPKNDSKSLLLQGHMREKATIEGFTRTNQKPYPSLPPGR